MKLNISVIDLWVKILNNCNFFFFFNNDKPHQKIIIN